MRLSSWNRAGRQLVLNQTASSAGVGCSEISPGPAASAAPGASFRRIFQASTSLMNGGGWREHPAGVFANSMGSLVGALGAGYAQYGQAAGLVGELPLVRIGSGSRLRAAQI